MLNFSFFSSLSLQPRMPPSPSSAAKSRPVKRTSHGPGGVDNVVLGQEHVVYTCGVKEAQMRTALEPSLKAAALTSPTAGGRPAVVAMLDRERAVPKGPVGGPDHLSTVWTDNLPVPAESLAEAQRRVVFDPSAREDVVKQPEAGRRVEPKWLGESIRTTKPAGGDQSVQLAWPEARVPHAVPVNRRLSSSGNQFAAAAESPAGVAPRPRDSMGSILGASSGEAVEPTMAAIQKRKLLYPDQPLAGKAAKYLPGLDPARQGVLDAPGTALPEPWSAPSPRGPPASSVGSLLSHGSEGEAAAPVHRGSRLNKEQPLGGRGLLASTGIAGLDAPVPVLGASVAARGPISQITF